MVAFTPIDAIGLSLALILLYKSYRLLNQGKESVLEFLFWSGFGTAMLLLVIGNISQETPLIQFAHSFSTELGFESGVNGVLVVAILSLLMIVFHTYIQVKNQRKKMYDLDRELALIQYQLDQKQKEQDADSEYKRK